jgi:hypothetical protein
MTENIKSRSTNVEQGFFMGDDSKFTTQHFSSAHEYNLTI